MYGYQAITFLLLLCCTLVSSNRILHAEHIDKDFSMKIVGGQRASDGQFPWIVYIQIQLTETIADICGGSILSPYHILTAAHCVSDGSSTKSASAVTVFAGQIDKNKFNSGASISRKVSDVFVHPDYIISLPEEHRVDLAILVLKKKLSFNTNIQPIVLGELADNYLIEGPPTVLTVAGWGSTTANPADSGISDFLNFVDVPVVTIQRCRFVTGYSLNSTITFCAGETGKDSCAGDSGGPIVYWNGTEYIQLGAVSAGPPICNGNYGIYTILSPFLGWIEDVQAISGAVSLSPSSFVCFVTLLLFLVLAC